MHLLIPYVQLNNHLDPDFSEYTYGDGGQRGHKLKQEVEKGDYIFFHTSKNKKKYITAYYIVDRVMRTINASRDEKICVKYHNPHITQKLYDNDKYDTLVFGDPITSQVLKTPLLFDRKLASKLSISIKYPTGRTETQAIVSATRNWRELTQKDVQILLKEIDKEQKLLRPFSLRSSDEVTETLERDIEYYITHNSSLIGKGLTLYQQQIPIGDGRLDALFNDKQGNWIVVEIKLGAIGRGALHQIKAYMHDIRKETRKKVSGVIVCSGVMPTFEDEIRKQKDIRILVYGWDLQVRQW